MHAFVDGNGRLQRWLVHQVLAAAGYNPPGLVFPVSAAVLRRLDDYRRVLESYSAPLRSYVDWWATESGNVEVCFLEAFDRFAAGVKDIVEMPDRQVERLRGFLQQGGGRLSTRAHEQEFAALTGTEAERIEALNTR